MIEIEDDGLIRKLSALAASMTDGPNHFSLEWLKQSNWTAVPVPDSMNDMDAEWLAEAAKMLGVDHCMAVSIETDESPACYRVQMEQEDILRFDLDFSLSNFLLLPIDGSFAVLKEAGLYFIVAGQEAFVRKAIGCSLRTARAMFVERYIEGGEWPERTRETLQQVAARYAPFNGWPVAPASIR